MSKITLNIVELGGSTPIDPVVPNTGLFTHGIGGPEATIITVSIVAILAIVAAVLYYREKHNKNSKANKIVESINAVKVKKKLSIPLAALALVVSLSTLTALLVNAGKSNTSAVEGDTENSLTVTESSEDLTIEVADTPVFAVLPVELTVEEATEAGYTLTAFAANTDLVSTTDGSKVIPMVAADEGELVALADNTYGLALDNKPASKDNEVYTTLSTDADNPTFITDKDYEGTGENDKTTIYYGFYITPDTPKGTYEGSEITYEAKENTATVVFDGNGLYFNGDESQTTNTANYIIETSDNTEKYSHTPNVNNAGVKEANLNYGVAVNSVVTIPGAAKLNIELTYGGGLWYGSQFGYLSFWTGSHPDYRANTNYETGIQSCGSSAVTDGRFGTDSTETTVECEITGDTVTFDYWTSGDGPGGKDWYGYYAVVTGYDADGNIIYLPENKIIGGDYLTPGSDSYYRFLGWSEETEATTPTYTTEESIEKELDLTLGETTTLYAVWQAAYTISYNGNGADSTTNMDNVEQYTTNIETTSQVDLLASNFTKSGHGFAGWSTDQDAWTHLTDDDESNNPTIYGPNQMITVDPSASTKLTLYAVWAPAETDASGNPISLQDWQGCSTLTPTTYNTETGQLAVGKNTITALTDSRDGNIYTVARLADGNCWMTENLRLDNEATISTANTNNPVVVDSNVAIKNNDGNTSAHLSPTTNSWCTNNDSECYDQSYLNTNNTALTTTSPILSQDFTNSVHDLSTGSLNTNISSYSNYYNWYSATAGNGTYDKSFSEVAGDICPAGWNLPMGNSNNTSGSFYYLNQQMGGNASTQGSNNWRSFPNNFVYSGFRSGSSADSRGYYGYYWSSTAYGTRRYAHYLLFYSNSVDPGTSGGTKRFGFSVRCVAPVQ